MGAGWCFWKSLLGAFRAQGWPHAAAENAGCIQSDACLSCLQQAGSLGGKHAWRSAPCAANCYPDGAVADEAVRQIERNAAAPETRFFLAVGFKRPHLGWMAPTEYFDMYNASEVAIAKHRAPPAGIPAKAWSGNGEICGMDDVTCGSAGGYSGIVPDAMHGNFDIILRHVISSYQLFATLRGS